MRISWSHTEVDERLQRIMSTIHARCVHYGKHNGYIDDVDGANIAGFQKVVGPFSVAISLREMNFRSRSERSTLFQANGPTTFQKVAEALLAYSVV